jgi:hypothetical protein
MRFHLTERFVKTLNSEEGRSPIFRDDELIGFGVQVRPNGRKSFTLDYIIDAGSAACSSAITLIGPSSPLAKKQSGKSARSILGHDPLAHRDGRRSAPTIKDLIERYIDEHGADPQQKGCLRSSLHIRSLYPRPISWS